MPSSTSPAMASADGAAAPYCSLEELRGAHSVLLHSRRDKAKDEAAYLDRVLDFIRRGQATGAVISGSDERLSAQSLLTYWSNIADRAGRAVPEPSLHEFEPTRSSDLTAGKANPYLRLVRPKGESLSRFPGWQRLIAESVRAVEQNQVVALVGAPGGGRAVLLQGGLLPALRGGHFLKGSDAWDYLTPFTPGKDPLADLVRALGSSIPGNEDVAACIDKLARNPDHINQFLAGSSRPIVVVVERFEEVLTQGEPARARLFADCLLALIQCPEPRHRVLVVSDSAGLARVKALGPFGRLMLQGQVLVTFTAAELRAMVVDPAKEVGLRFDDGLVDRLLLDVQGDPGALSLLQFTLQLLWDARQSGRVTHEIYDKVGGGRLAVAQKAEQVYAELPNDEQAAARAILLRLIRPALGTGVSCPRVPADQLVPATEQDSAARRAFEKLVAAGLVVAIDSGGERPIEYAAVHESLATAWPRFLEWLEDARGAQQWGLRLRAAAEQWQFQDRKVGALWSGAVLVVALDEAERRKAAGEPLNWLEQDFLDASRAADRRMRIARWSIILAAVAVCIAGAVAAYIRQVELVKLHRAMAETESARAEAEEAAREAEEFGRMEADLLNASWQVQKGADQAAQSQFADPSAALLWYAEAWSHFRESAAVVEDETERHRLRAGNLLRLGVAQRQLPALIGMAYHPKAARFSPTAVSSDGKVLLTVGDEEGKKDRPAARAWFWSGTPNGGEWVSTALPWGMPREIRTPDVTGAYLSQDGRLAVVTAQSGKADWKACVWSIPTSGAPRLEATLSHRGRVTAMDFSPNGDYFAAVSAPPKAPAAPPAPGGPPAGVGSPVSQVILWRAGRWKEPALLSHPAMATEPLNLAFSPESDRLAAVVGSSHAPQGGNPIVCLEWALESFPPPGRANEYTAQPPLGPASPWEKGFALYAPAGGEKALFVSRGRDDHLPDAWLFSARGDSTRTGTRVVSRHTGPILHAGFSPSGNRLASAGAEGMATLFTVSRDKRGPLVASATHSLTHDASVFHVNFSPEGRYLLTASRDRRAQVWDADTGNPTHPCFHHTGSVDLARFTLDGRQVVTSSLGVMYRWDLIRGEPRPMILGLPQRDRVVAIDPKGRSILAAGNWQAKPGGWARVWDAKTGTPRTPALRHPAGVRHAALSPADLGLVSTADDEGTLRLWKVRASDRLVWSAPPNPWKAVYTAFGQAGNDLRLLAVTREKPTEPTGRARVRVWTVAVGEPAVQGEPFEFEYDGPFTAASFSPDGTRVVAYTGEGDRGVAVVWEVGRNNAPIVLKREGLESAHTEPITSATFSEGGDQLLTTGRDDAAVVWSVPGGRGEVLQGTLGDIVEDHSADILTAAFDRSGHRVVTAGADRQAIVWARPDRWSRYRPVVLLNLGTAPVQAAFSADEKQRYVLTVGENTTRLWDAKDGRTVATNRSLGWARLGLCETTEKGDLSVLMVGSPNPGTRPPDGSGWLAVSEWDLSPAVDPSPDRLRLLAEVTASRQLVQLGDIVQIARLAPEAVYDRWLKGARLSASARPRPPGGEGGWHDREAAWAEAGGRWSAAQFHLRHELPLVPEAQRPMLRVRLALAQVNLAEAADHANTPRAREEWEAAMDLLSEALGVRRADMELLQPRGSLPGSRDLLLARARVSFRLGRYADAIADYSSLLKADSKDRLTRIQLAEAYDRVGDLKRAAAECDVALHDSPQDADLLRRRAVILAKDGQFERAFADFLAAARVFKAKGQGREAEDVFARALSLKKQVHLTPSVEAAILAERGDLLFSQSADEEALKSFTEAVALDSTVWTYWQGQARSYQRLGKWKEAAQALEEAHKRNPKNVSLALSRANARVRLKQWGEAARAYRDVIELEPEAMSHRLRLAAIYLQPAEGDKEARPERFEEAIRCLAEATQALPAESFAWVQLAALQLKAKKDAAYRDTRRRILELFADKGHQAGSNAAWAAAFAPDTPEGAARTVELALKSASASPRDPNYLMTLGAALYRAGKWEESVARLQEASKERLALSHLSTEPLAAGNAFGQLFQAMAEHAAGRPAPARNTLRSAVTEIDRVNDLGRSESPDQSLSRVWTRLQLELLQREAELLIKTP